MVNDILLIYVQEDDDEDKVDPKEREKELKDKIESLKKLAIKKKNEGDVKQAKAYLLQMKTEKDELDMFYKMHPKLK